MLFNFSTGAVVEPVDFSARCKHTAMSLDPPSVASNLVHCLSSGSGMATTTPSPGSNSAPTPAVVTQSPVAPASNAWSVEQSESFHENPYAIQAVAVDSSDRDRSPRLCSALATNHEVWPGGRSGVRAIFRQEDLKSDCQIRKICLHLQTHLRHACGTQYPIRSMGFIWLQCLQKLGKSWQGQYLFQFATT